LEAVARVGGEQAAAAAEVVQWAAAVEEAEDPVERVVVGAAVLERLMALEVVW
jgi:hypothetical protein